MSVDRRTVVRGTAALLVAGCGPPPSGGESGATTPPTGDTAPTSTTSTTATPACGYVHQDSWFPLAMADYPELATIGGYSYADLSGERLILARLDEGCVAALDRICTHQGCEIKFSFGRFSCPCHGSVWNPQGELQAGPATNQDAFPAELDGETLWLEIG